MKAILPILICSAISAALGYYFGHITVPTDQGAPATVASSSETGTTAPEPQVAAVPDEDSFEPEPELEPEPEPEELEIEPEETAEATPPPTESDFAERAAKTIQTLTDKQGRSINARIVEVMETEVKIRRSDGLESTIPLNMLSEEDAAFCNYLREQQKTEEPALPDTSDGFDWDSYFNS